MWLFSIRVGDSYVRCFGEKDVRLGKTFYMVTDAGADLGKMLTVFQNNKRLRCKLLEGSEGGSPLREKFWFNSLKSPFLGRLCVNQTE